MEFGNWALFKLLLFGKPWGMRGRYFFRGLFLSFWLMIFKLIKFLHFLLFFYFISTFFDKLCAMGFIISSLFLFRLISISLLFVVSAPEIVLYFGFNFLLPGLTHLSIPIPKIIFWFLLFILILLLLFFLLLLRF